MPGGNRTGPNGEGSRTGRGLGYCSGSDTPGYMKKPGIGAGSGFRTGRGFGCGRGRGSRNAANYGNRSVWNYSGDESGYLESRFNSLKQEIASLTKRLNELGAQSPSKKE